jgi:hypothetical protein
MAGVSIKALLLASANQIALLTRFKPKLCVLLMCIDPVGKENCFLQIFNLGVLVQKTAVCICRLRRSVLLA